MGRQSQSTAWSTVVVMGLKVTLGCLLAFSVSSVPLDAGYGAPAAPPLVLAPRQPATLPLQLVHAAPQPVPLPLVHNHAQPIFHSAPEPLIHPLPAAAPVISPLPAAAPLVHNIPAPAPLAPQPLPLAPIPVPIQAPSSQFHAQDEFGQFSFGYEYINSAKTETKDAFGVTRGSYQYVDANGIVQTVNYIADDINGFRVAGTNIPVAGAQPLAAAPLVAPVPVLETPEVAAARAEHLAAHAEAKAAVDAANSDAKEEEEL